jgi:hypothetical protein
VNATFYVVRDGTKYTINSGNQLTAGDVYAFELAYQADEQVNFAFSFTGTGTLGYLRVLYRRWV